MSLLAYNLVNLWRPPRAAEKNRRLVPDELTAAAREDRRTHVVKHARYYWLLLAESHLTRHLFGQMLRLIDALPVPSG